MSVPLLGFAEAGGGGFFDDSGFPAGQGWDEIAASHALFIEWVNAGMVPHRDQPEVTKSLEFATTRNIGRSGMTWEQSDPTKPITIAQAVTWALWGVLKSEASPKKSTPAPPAPGVIQASTPRGEANVRTIQF